MINIDDWPDLDKEKLFSYLGDNAFRSEKNKLLYIATPKVACTSLKWWFAELEGFAKDIRQNKSSAESDPDLMIHDSFHRVAPNITGLIPTSLIESLTSDGYFRFAVVRNPYKRIFSAWQSKLLLREPLQVGPYIGCDFYNQSIENSADLATAFENFLEHLATNEAPNFLDVHWTPQADLLRPDLINYSKLVKIENANELSTALSEWLGAKFVNPFSTRNANESLIPYLPELITKRSAELIQKLYVKDFITFGYSVEMPLSVETFSNAQFNLAFKAIEIIRGRHQRLGEMSGQITSLNQALSGRDDKITNLNHVVTGRDDEIANLNLALILIKEQDIKNQAISKEILNSKCWKITKPLRFIGELAKKTSVLLRSSISNFSRQIWLKFPASTNHKQLFKHQLFSHLPIVFKWSQAYRSWYAMSRASTATYGLSAYQASQHEFKQSVNDYVPLLYALPPKDVPVRLIAFYLPQFHAIAENNKWWGEDFTEWTNVKPAQPQFEGHYQPHVPNELGYYNLLDSSTQLRQIELAKLHGVGGFCFYTYWFAGKLLLEKPIENYLNDSALDFPFCLCWANENWSRRWDGLDNDILMAQKHSPDDDLAFIEHVSQYMKDARYIRIDGKPLLLVYRPSLLPSAKETAKRWRDWCLNNGIGEIYLAYTQSFETVDPIKYGFDAAIEFPPNNSAPPNITNTVKPLSTNFSGTVYDWNVFVERSRGYSKPAYKLFRSVCPAWDNTARRKTGGTVFLNSTPQKYQEWLTNAVVETCTRIANLDERLIFVNAWNEWAEGAHLEPDQHYGYAYLDATRKALVSQSSNTSNNKIIVVSHDAHPHGAQFLALGMVRALKLDLKLEVEVVLLGKGKLTQDFAALAPIHDLSELASDNQAVTKLANSLFKRGFNRAIANTTVSGSVIPIFYEAGIESICLVHELSGVILSHGLQNHTKQIAEYAKAVVFPAQIVADDFSQFATINSDKQIIRPQGLYRRNKWRFDKNTAKNKLRKQLGINENCKIVLTVGYADHRKGVDLFVECAFNILAKRTDVDFVWVGHWEQAMQIEIEAKLLKSAYKNRIHFVGYNPETALFHAASDVYALTSREDPFPNVVLESFDAGVPVVAFASTGGAAHLVQEVGGLVVPLQDVNKFSNAICQLLDNAELSSSLGKAAQNHIDKHLAFRPYLFELCALLGINLPKVSVVVPNYNYAQYIEKRLATISNQTTPIYELIILDDASKDSSVNKISEWLATTQTEARVVINQTNSGSVFSQWNKGISLATGDYLWIAEADDLSEPDFLETVLQPLISGDAVLSYCESQQINADGIIQSKNYKNYLSAACDNKWESAYIKSGVEECSTSLAILNTIPNVSAVVFKHEVISKVFKEHFEEVMQYKKAGDWVVYLYTLGYGKIAFSPRIANLHRRHDGSVVGNSDRESILLEIVTVQEIVKSLYMLSDDVEQKVQKYRFILTQ